MYFHAHTLVLFFLSTAEVQKSTSVDTLLSTERGGGRFAIGRSKEQIYYINGEKAYTSVCKNIVKFQEFRTNLSPNNNGEISSINIY
jgi:hypothetical protein